VAREKEKVSGAEEFVAAEIDLATPLEPEEEKKLRSALREIDPQAFDSCDIAPSKISLCYDPTRTSKGKLLELIRASGARLEKVTTEKSPLS
jgi:hypothetical protein